MSKYSIAKIPIDVLRETAEKLRRLRKMRKWSQAELAERSGVSLGSVKRFEQTGRISFESLLKLAHVLGRLGDFEALFAPEEIPEEVVKLFEKNKKKK